MALFYAAVKFKRGLPSLLPLLKKSNFRMALCCCYNKKWAQGAPLLITRKNYYFAVKLAVAPAEVTTSTLDVSC